MDKHSSPYDTPHKQTVCPADIFLSKGEAPAEGIIPYISIPFDYSAYDSDPDDATPSTPDSSREESSFEDDWPEIHDILFQSIGLERVPGCWQKVQEKLGGTILNEYCQPVGTDCGMPMLPGDLQDELIGLYFRQFHPICPAVNQTEFLRWYQAPEEYQDAHPQLMQLVLFSILFAASSHADESILRHGPYATVKEAQKALFTYAQTLYHRLELTLLGAEALAQSALLLSYWSPYDSTKEVNSFWVDEAIRHAVAGGMSDPSSKHRRRIIWWCCLIRNRMVSLGLRRFSRLATRADGRLPETMDFEDEVSEPHFTSTEAKVYFTRAFTLLCSLTRIMVQSVRLKYRDYNRTWSFPNNQQAVQILAEVGQLEGTLNIWSANFAHLYATVRKLVVPHTDLVIFHIISLMHQYAISILYEPFLRLADGPGSQTWLVKDLALLKIKEVSTNTAAITASMLRFAQPKDLPITLPPWLILPIALHVVQLSQHQDFEVKTETAQQLGSLMRALHSLTCRFEGAQFVIKIINAIIMFVRISSEEVSSNNPPIKPGAGYERGRGIRYPRSRQGKIVTHVLEAIRTGLADGIVTA